MATVTYRKPDGTVTVLDVPAGSTVMRGALTNGIEGIEGECGGDGICATCHVYVDHSPVPLPEIDENEGELLDCTSSPRKPNSRLSCQLPVTEELDSLVVTLPATQV
ncbi:(2Fe-2S)-binding protein [Actinospica acidiphila]|uniref:(2Fe-2S)-binding protein n=1 Tax=Actinospica acidiphila TaxID=304899 RepID=A0A9X5CSB6_9ACTN|nr:2Fe-2S iron-sulfur cluster-binding protein [Actinospica acidiphila]NEC53770.1 (2Fe-2S)-binding protein [Actinospica acidiphila]